ncbi:heparanase-like protein 2 isoform X1 [Elaeis guineensis]|uniref:Heparanase-like protein 2 isoform X1 n=1 Tax=Elaeis guineensis var. tenera TaxID=51953 RepID=A0A6I9RCC9_ELAGV|nr:heparanase-like protein 2 isoform X1 [Elaeis guineensis]
MGFHLVLFLVLCALPGIFSKESADVTVIVRGSATVAKTNDHFVCATLDWWPPEKCNYNQCPWGQSSILNLDLTHPLLAKAIQAFNSLRIRVGGSLQDQVIYGVPNFGGPCLPIKKMAGGLFGFSKGCLSMARWDKLNLLFQKTGAIVTFGLNALNGRHHIHNGVWGGDWNSSNARAFIEYTISKGYPVDSWEFGNELSGHGVGASVSVEQYGKDLVHLKAILDELYKDSRSKPQLVAPGGFFDQPWYAHLLQLSGSGVLNAMTHHIYNLGGGNDPHITSKITDPQYLSREADTFRSVQLTIKNHGPWASAWVSEAGGAYNSGSRLVSSTFLDSFWYLDELGMASKYNTKVYCRQTLIGGNYGLLDTKTFIPNPDYYGALLWSRLMGNGVLSIDLSGSPYLRAYAHCRKKKQAGVSLLLINLSESTEFTVTVRNDINVNLAEGGGIQRDGAFVHGLKKTVSWVGRRASDESEMREEYHLTAKDGNHLSRTVLLNGTPLELTKDGDIPPLNPVSIAANSPISMAPLSIAFVVFPKFEAQACV